MIADRAPFGVQILFFGKLLRIMGFKKTVSLMLI